MKKKAIHYVDNKKFLEAILEYKHQKKTAIDVDKVKISNYIGECIYKIATNLANKPCFNNYSFREEMIGDGIENCFLYFDQFDPGKTQNPFAYFTTIIYYAFIRRIQKEEKNRYVRYKSFYDVVGTDLGVLMEDGTANRQSYENIDIFIEKFEAKLEVKRLKSLEKKNGLEKYYATAAQESGKNTTSNTKFDLVAAK
jgi:hypothetical protein